MSHVVMVMSRVMSSVCKRECAGERESASQHQGCKSHGVSFLVSLNSIKLLIGFRFKAFKAPITQFGELPSAITKSMPADASSASRRRCHGTNATIGPLRLQRPL